MMRKTSERQYFCFQIPNNINEVSYQTLITLNGNSSPNISCQANPTKYICNFSVMSPLYTLINVQNDFLELLWRALADGAIYMET